MTRQEFVKKVNSMIPANTKILRSITLAQAIVESSDSKGVVANSTLTVLGNALFGIKATSNWKGKAMNCKTREVYDIGEWHGVQPFRAYNSWQESITDHERFLTVENPVRYKSVIGERDYKKAAHALKAAGYATAKNYAEVLISIIESEQLYLYDVLAPFTPANKPAVSPTQPASVRTYTIKPGDSFWKIALTQLGNGNRYIELAKFNNLTTQTVIHPGQVIKLPNK